MTIKPLFGNVLIKPIDIKESSEGILLPASSDNAKIGEVLALGTGEFATISSMSPVKLPFDVKVGDMVSYKERDLISLENPNQKCFLINQRNLLAIIHED